MTLKVAIIVNESIEKVWDCWTQADHIMEWHNPSDSWYVSNAQFEASPHQPRDVQDQSWQTILRSFKDYVEN